MLVDLLKELNNSPTFSKKSLANKLNTSEDMIEEGLSQLMRMGYIENHVINQKCNLKCKTCSIKSCNLNPIKSFIITKKGRKVLAKIS